MKDELAKNAIHVEQNIIKENVGSQDQITAAFGGFNRIEFRRDGSFDVVPVILPPARLSELRAMLEKWLPPAQGDAGATPGTATTGEDAEEVGQPVDITVLEELVGRDPDVTREFLRAFWISTAKTASELKEACRNKEMPLIADLAHRLKSPAKSVGAMRLAELCEDLEEAGRASDLKAVEKGLPRFEREAARVGAYLREI